MANVRTSESKSRAKNKIKVRIFPATDNARKLGFVKVNGKILPFELPVEISENDLKALKGLREPVKEAMGVDVHKIMDDLRISQEKANRIARLNESKEMNSKVRWVNKYIVNVL